MKSSEKSVQTRTTIFKNSEAEKEKPLSYMKKVHDSAKFRSLRWHYPDQVRSKFNTSSQTVHRLPYIIWTYDNEK